ncbi:hypothetical protein MTR_4g428420 [Medicago truncatula]|uniref:Uncharacterized protein n=1 Tax=Medicago truncatula TaxID=3880 RepID=A0A072UIB5_MEDTR|nr:hypothetical protein MTR_4g428420 [Medicago truncatula]
MALSYILLSSYHNLGATSSSSCPDAWYQDEHSDGSVGIGWLHVVTLNGNDPYSPGSIPSRCKIEILRRIILAVSNGGNEEKDKNKIGSF